MHFFFIFVVLGFELRPRASRLLGRQSYLFSHFTSPFNFFLKFWWNMDYISIKWLYIKVVNQETGRTFEMALLSARRFLGGLDGRCMAGTHAPQPLTLGAVGDLSRVVEEPELHPANPPSALGASQLPAARHERR
jgi:hypothetical protein